MKRISSLLIGAGLVALQGCSAAPVSEQDLASESNAVTPSGSAKLTITSDWGSGYCANVDLTNALTVATARWQVLIDFKGLAVPAAPWNTTFETNGKYTTAHPASYNTQIAPNGTVSFGFCGNSVAGGPRPSVVAYNMEMNLFTTCQSNNGVNPTLAALAVAMATELGRWEPDQDLQKGNTVTLKPGAPCKVAGCPNTKAILGQQTYTTDQNAFNNTNYMETLKAMFDRQTNAIINANPKPISNYFLTLVGGPTSLGYGNCGPHYIYRLNYNNANGAPLSSNDAKNLLPTLCFFGQGNCGSNPYISPQIGDSSVITSCPTLNGVKQMCIAIDPTDGDNGSTSTTTAGSAPTYPKNVVYDPANTLLGTQCITTKGLLGTMVSKCSLMPDTCGNLYCVAN